MNDTVEATSAANVYALIVELVVPCIVRYGEWDMRGIALQGEQGV